MPWNENMLLYHKIYFCGANKNERLLEQWIKFRALKYANQQNDLHGTHESLASLSQLVPLTILIWIYCIFLYAFDKWILNRQITQITITCVGLLCIQFCEWSTASRIQVRDRKWFMKVLSKSKKEGSGGRPVMLLDLFDHRTC